MAPAHDELPICQRCTSAAREAVKLEADAAESFQREAHLWLDCPRRPQLLGCGHGVILQTFKKQLKHQNLPAKGSGAT